MDDPMFTAVNKLIKINREHKRLIDSQVAELGIHRTRHRILMHIAKKGGLPSQKKLAEHLEVSPAAITDALQKLEADGYIERKPGTDSRFNEITITQKGREIVEKTKERFAAIDDRLFAGFSSEEMAEFVAYLARILENVKENKQ